jgi:hypothetical protein
MFPGQSSPWSILELDALTATRRDVKRAYARLLKRHRPDSDPEGFQRIHGAYETVLREIELREEGDAGMPEPVFVMPAGSVLSLDEFRPVRAKEIKAAELPGLPQPFLAAMGILREVRTSGNTAPAAGALTQLRLVCGEDPALWCEWSKALAEIFDEGLTAAGIAPLMETEDVLFELRAGESRVAFQMLDYWRRGGMLAEMVAMGKALTNQSVGGNFDRGQAGFFALRLAFYFAIPQPGGAGMLLDAAFFWLPARERTMLIPGVEQRLHLGRLFWHLPPKSQRCWEGILDELDNSKTPDWNGEVASRALAELVFATPNDWAGWQFLRSVLPTARWARLADALYNRRARPPRPWEPPPAGTWLPLDHHGRREAAWAAIPLEERSSSTSNAGQETNRASGSGRGREFEWLSAAGAMPLRKTRMQKIGRGCYYLFVGGFCLFLLFGVLAGWLAPGDSKPYVSPGSSLTLPAPSKQAHLNQIKSVVELFPATGPLLKTFLAADRAGQLKTVESIGAFAPAEESEKALLVCCIVHPNVLMGVKQKAIARIVEIAPPAEAVQLLRMARIPGAATAGTIDQLVLTIYREHGSKFPESLRSELRGLDKQPKKEKTAPRKDPKDDSGQTRGL